MTAESPDVRDLFDRAFDVAREDRDAYLVQACAGHDDVLAEVRALFRELDGLDSEFLVPDSGVGGLHYRLLGTGAGLDQTLLGAPPEPPDYVGREIHGRFKIESVLGSGSFGAVYRATDAFFPDPVAIKILLRRPSSRPEWRFRELAALRLVDVPGVIRLLDVGEYEGHEFLVTEFFDGSAFPGARGRSWPELREPVLRFLDALARLHAAGVVHGDLKPGNVLVDVNGGVGIVDFGIAGGPGLERPDHDGGGTRLGTLAYLAPEQLREPPASATAATDQYAAALMLYEALVGSVPHVSDSVDEFMKRRAHRPADLSRLPEDVPPFVRDLLEVALAPEVEDRPPSVHHLVWALRGRRGGAGPIVQRLAHSTVERVVAALERALAAGTDVDLVGPRGSGKQLIAQWVAAALERAGVQVLRDDHGADPYELDLPAPSDGLRTAVVVVGDRPAAELRAHGFDAADVVLGCARRSPGGIELQPVSRDELMEVIRGPDRVLHLREDGADELLRRTGGRLGLLADELEAWFGGGLVAEEDGLLVFERRALDRLRFLGPQTIHAEPDGPLPAAGDARRLALARRLSPGATIDEVARALEEPAEVTRAALVGLQRDGWVTIDEDGRLYGVATPHDAPALDLSDETLIGGLEDDDPRRLVIALASGDARLAADELIAAFQREFDLSHEDAALECARLAFRVAVVADSPDLLERAIRCLVRVGAATVGARVVELVLSDLERRSEVVPDDYLTLLRAALKVRRFGMCDETPEDVVPEFELPFARYAAVQLRVRVATYVGADSTRAQLDRARAVLSEPPARGFRADLPVWQAWAAYRRLDFVGAAGVASRALDEVDTPRVRLHLFHALVFAVSETGDTARAASLARRMASAAAEVRAPAHELEAALLTRQIQYAIGHPVEVDLALLALVDLFHQRTRSAAERVRQAAIAWRGGSVRFAATLAGVAARELIQCGSRDTAALALAICRQGGAVGGHSDEELLEHVRTCSLPGVFAQACALLARQGVALARSDRERAIAAIQKLGALPRDLRREVLSIRECEEWLGGTARCMHEEI